MKVGNDLKSGFTIVELLFVIVVIGILAALVVSTLSGAQDRARTAQVEAAADNAAKKIRAHKVVTGQYPDALADVGIADDASLAYEYTAQGEWFCAVAKTTTATPVHAGKGTSGACGALTVDYFNNANFTGPPSRTGLDQKVDYNWGGGAPVPELNPDYFSVRWTGYITAPVSGEYTLNIWHDNYAKLYIDDVLLAHFDSSYSCCTWRPVSYHFVAGERLSFVAEIAEITGGAGLRLNWSYPGQSDTPIPASAFSPV